MLGIRLKLGGHLWHHRDFQKLWLSDTVSQFGNSITNLALPTVAILFFNATALQIGILFALGMLAFPVFGLFVGVWVDRLRRRPIMIICNFGRMASLASVPIAFTLDILSMNQLYLVAAINGVLTVFFDVAYQSYLPSLVEREDLIEGNQKLQTSAAAASVAGPPIAGFLISLVGAARSILADATGYLISAISLAAIRKSEPFQKREQKRTTSFFGEMKEGIHVVTKNPILWHIAGATATSNLGSSMYGAVLLLFAYNEVHLTPFLVGITGAPGGAAFVIGVFLVGAFTKKLRVGGTLVVSLMFGLAALATPVALLGSPVIILGAIAFLTSLGSPIYNIVQISLRQAVTPDRVQGRMNATMRTIVWGTLPAGSLIGGIFGTLIGVIPTVLVGAAVQGFAFLWILLGPVFKVKEQPKQVEEVREEYSPPGAFHGTPSPIEE